MMKFEFSMTDDKESSGCKDEDGQEYFTSTCVISYVDPTTNEHHIVDDWQSIYTMENKEVDCNEQRENGLQCIENIKNYIRVHGLMLESAILQERKTYCLEMHTNEHMDEIENHINSVKLQLDQAKTEQDTICCALAHNKMKLHEIDPLWIATNMVNDSFYIMAKDYLIQCFKEQSNPHKLKKSEKMKMVQENE